MSAWPTDVVVPLRTIPDRSINPGKIEGERCLRDDGRGGLCQGIIEYIPDPDFEGCSCHIAPPCGYCTSTMPECDTCGWREDDDG